MQPQSRGSRRHRQRVIVFSVLAGASGVVCVLNVVDGEPAGRRFGTTWALLGVLLFAVMVDLLIATLRRKID